MRPIDLDWTASFAQGKGVKMALSEYAAGAPASGGEGSGAGLDDGAWTAAAIANRRVAPRGSFCGAPGATTRPPTTS